MGYGSENLIIKQKLEDAIEYSYCVFQHLKRRKMMIPKDKLLHFVAGSICSAFVYVITLNLALAIGASALLGIAKEVYDSRGHGTVEVADAVATAVGGAVGAVIIRVVM
jgi:hypothetical protein